MCGIYEITFTPVSLSMHQSKISNISPSIQLMNSHSYETHHHIVVVVGHPLPRPSGYRGKPFRKVEGWEIDLELAGVHTKDTVEYTVVAGPGTVKSDDDFFAFFYIFFGGEGIGLCFAWNGLGGGGWMDGWFRERWVWVWWVTTGSRVGEVVDACSRLVMGWDGVR